MDTSTNHASNCHCKSQKGGTSKINHRPRQAELQRRPGIPHSSPGGGRSRARRLLRHRHVVLHYQPRLYHFIKNNMHPTDPPAFHPDETYVFPQCFRRTIYHSVCISNLSAVVNFSAKACKSTHCRLWRSPPTHNNNDELHVCTRLGGRPPPPRPPLLLRSASCVFTSCTPHTKDTNMHRVAIRHFRNERREAGRGAKSAQPAPQPPRSRR